MLLPAQFEALGVLSGSVGRFVGMQLPDAACLLTHNTCVMKEDGQHVAVSCSLRWEVG